MANLLESIRRFRHTLLPLPVKYGKRFREVFDFLKRHQYCSQEELEAFQWGRLKSLLDYAYRHVPFYRKRFDSAGVHPDDIRAREDLRRIPILTKEEVVANFEDFKSDEFEKLKPIRTTTSGTTRDYMVMYRSRETEIWRNALVWRHYHNLGYQFRDRRARLTVRIPFVDDDRQMPIDHNENELLIDPTAISLAHSKAIYRRLRDFAPKMITCQAANLVYLTECFQRNKLEPFSIPTIYTLGEKLYPQYERVIRSFYGGNVTVYYANRENTAAACDFGDGNLYIQTDYCLLEFLDEEGREVVGRQGDIISTSLINHAFPLIRYHTDDVGINHGVQQGARWHYPVMEIIGGRGKDLVLTRQGLRCPYIWYAITDAGMTRAQQFQGVQTAIDRILIRVVPLPEFRDPEDVELTRKAVEGFFEGEMKVEVELVDKLPTTQACKNPMIISELAMNYLKDRLNEEDSPD